jgi:hypothetical protein
MWNAPRIDPSVIPGGAQRRMGIQNNKTKMDSRSRFSRVGNDT